MFKIESYVTPILLSYVDKYVKDFKPADAQVSLWGGGVLLQNLVLKTDVLQQEVALPFTLVSGRIHELVIQVPWTKIMSEPIIVTIDTIECILNLRPPSNEEPKPELQSERAHVVEAPPGYMQALVRRVVSNIAIKVHHLIVKYVQDDIVLSLNVKELSVNSAGPDWKPTFADIEAANPVIRRLIVLDDLTLCLDSTDSDGKIRFYQDPLLYRCGLEFRVLAKLASANTRRAKSFEVQMLTARLAWGITTAQLLLLLRLVKEPVPPENETPSPTAASKNPQPEPGTPNPEEPTRHESWTDWAWSWMPSTERIHGKSETPMASCPVPISFSAYLDHVSLAIKTLETEANNKKRPRSILELTASYAAIKSSLCVPTYLRIKIGIRHLVLQSIGKCTCGHSNVYTISEEPTVYLTGKTEKDHTWKWPDEKAEIELAEIAEEKTKAEQKPGEITDEKSATHFSVKFTKERAETLEKKPAEESSSKLTADKSGIEIGKVSEAEAENNSSKEPEKESGPDTAEQTSVSESEDTESSTQIRSRGLLKPIPALEFDVADLDRRRKISIDAGEDAFWNKLSAVFSIEIVHERSPPNAFINPYDKPPKNFEYSDWEEQSDVHVQITPMDLTICMGLIHRLILIKNVFAELPPIPLEPMRTLTVEENEALSLNLPQRRTNIQITEFQVNLQPWDHSLTEKPSRPPILLRVELPKANVVIATPLYAQRVCSAAAQIPEDKGLLWQACRVHTTAVLNDIKISVCAPSGEFSKPCGRLDVRFVTHSLLYREYFEKKQSVVFSYALKMREANISGSSARLHAAVEVLKSLIKQTSSFALHQTTLANDALNDEDLVALDVTAEDLTSRGFMTNKVKTTMSTLQSLRATVFQSYPDKELQQAWLFSGPDIPTTTPFIRLITQWCEEPFPGSVEFLGLWTEPTALAVDPLLAAWLSYKPSPKSSSVSLHNILKQSSSMHSSGRRRSRTTMQSSSGRGQSYTSTADAEQVHKVSLDSSSEKSGRKEATPVPQPQVKPAESGWMGDNLLHLHERLKHVLIAVDLGLILIYVTTKTATAVGCDTVRLAMERHAAAKHSVMVYSIGRWSLFTATVTKHLWHFIDQNGPTYIKEKPVDSFPWKMLLGDMSCYSLESQRTVYSDPMLKKSQLKVTAQCKLCTIIELFSTNVVLSVVTKTLQHKVIVKKAEPKKKDDVRSKEEAKLRYFQTGTDFKPTTFLEFLRGPINRKREASTQSDITEPTSNYDKYNPVQQLVPGPVISLGFNLHADTPPLICRIENKQVHLVITTLHCMKHIVNLMGRSIIQGIQSRPESRTNLASNISRSEIDEEDRSSTESIEELITILPTPGEERQGIKTFFWFQWVISRITTVVTTSDVTKLVMEIEDMSMSLDIQENYDQFKIKIASAAIKYFEQTDENTWIQSGFGGRILHMAAESFSKEDTHFFSVTVTRARISKLPASWKEELHPKLLDQKYGADLMWEIYAVVSSLDVVIVPRSLDIIMQLLNIMTTKISCSPPQEQDAIYESTFDLPYCYLNAGGLKLAFVCGVDERKIDDTLILTITKTTINPHPDNPICRQPVSTSNTGWNVPGNIEGRQYELLIKGITLETTLYNQLATKQESISDTKVTNENPAVKWSSQVVEPTFSSILLPLDIDLLLAPALFVSGTLVCGPAVELNLTSDCFIKVNLDQLILLKAALKLISHAAHQKVPSYGDLRIGECPYEKSLKRNTEEVADRLHYIDPKSSKFALNEEDNVKAVSSSNIKGGPLTADSGTGTATSQSKSSLYLDTSLRKKVAVGFLDDRVRKASEYLEVFLTTGAFEVSLYSVDDGSEEIAAVKPQKPIPEEILEQEDELIEEKHSKESLKRKNIRMTELDLTVLEKQLQVKPNSNVVPLLHLTLHQPNLYYWKRRAQKSLQISLFNMWFGLGTLYVDDYWHAPILSTAPGLPDPDTEIPPALATMKYTSGSCYSGSTSMTNTTSLNQRGTLNLDIERPMHIDANEENVRRLLAIKQLINLIMMEQTVAVKETSPDPMPYKLRQLFIDYVVEVVTIQTSQIGMSVAKATLAFESASLQFTLTPRRDQLDARGLVSALFLTTTDNQYECRHPILHPVHIGLLMNASWEAWRRAEGGPSAKQPSVRVLVEVDYLTVDLSPDNLNIVTSVIDLLQKLETFSKNPNNETADSEDSFRLEADSSRTNNSLKKKSFLNMTSKFSYLDASDIVDHYYKDDLRSGAFRIVTGTQLPMAYEVTLHKNVISWRYPHPRAISRIVVFPLPNQDKEVDCVLEFYSLLLNRWEPYIVIKLPVSEPREFMLHSRPPELIFSPIWRIRIAADDAEETPYQFNMNRFMPSSEPTGLEYTEPMGNSGTSEITAEQLSGILSVDSYFSPSQTPQANMILRFGKLDLYLHNSLPRVNKLDTYLEGYYASKPLMLPHRTVLLSAEDAMMHLGCDSSAGSMLSFQTHLMTEIVECSTGTMHPLTDKFKLQVGLSIPDNYIQKSRVRLCTTRIRTALHLSRLRTIQSLADDWKNAFQHYVTSKATKKEETVINAEKQEDATNALEGRVSLWIHNTCSVPLRVGQDNTDEIFLIGPGTKLAYRWCYPSGKQRLQFAVVSPTTEWRWSTCVTFAVGESRIRLPDSEHGQTPGAGEFLYVTVKQIGAHRLMRLSGRLIIANMLKWHLLYKVRAQEVNDKTWSTVSGGELSGESIGRSIVCATNKQMVLKLKFLKQDSGWSGDIPLKECPKENVPWLVKVPSEGEVPYISVWCRVVRARTDGRIIAAIWPLYVLRSNLTLDTDVLLETDLGGTQQSFLDTRTDPSNPAPLIQTALGRGVRSHLLCPGTTSAKHSLSFQYRNVECPVTREAVPLHYGVTDTSVFDKRTPVNTIEEVLIEIMEWLKGGSQQPDPYWPHSIVSRHWKGPWQATLLQPRCEVVVRYQAVRVAGGGCSLEMQLSPVLLLCNASPILMTLRAHDAAPVCKLEPGSIVSPPSVVLQKPFFISIEIERETFVSRQLEVCSEDKGPYSAPPPGHLAVDLPTTFAIPCHNKVTILNAHYEIKDDFNIIGLTPTFVFVNRLDMEVSISTIALPRDQKGKPPHIHSKLSIIVRPNKRNSVEYVPLCHFAQQDRWRGDDVSELSLYLSVALKPTLATCPVRLGHPPFRKPLGLFLTDGGSMPVVLTQQKHEGRCVVTLSHDPCPQFLVENHASVAVCLAQPAPPANNAEPHRHLTMMPECEGVYWHCVLQAGQKRYYSTPAYQLSQPLPSQQLAPVLLSFTVFEQEFGFEPSWCVPVEMSGGEQLVQLSPSTMLKLRVRPYPHSTRVELHDVECTDISASGIRNRLAVPTNSREDTPKEVEEGPYMKCSIVKESVFSNRKLDMEQLEKDLHKLIEEQKPKPAMIKNKFDSVTSIPLQTSNEPDKETTKQIEDNFNNDGSTLPDNIKTENIISQESPDITALKKAVTIVIEPLASEEKETISVNIPTEASTSKDEKKSLTKRVTISTHHLGPDSKSTILRPNTSETKALKGTMKESITIADKKNERRSSMIFDAEDLPSKHNYELLEEKKYEWDENVQLDYDRIKCMISSVVVEMAATEDSSPLLALHVDQTHVGVSLLNRRIKTKVSITDVQIDNLQYESGQFDFPVIAATRPYLAEEDRWPTVWNLFSEQGTFSDRQDDSRVNIQTCHESWTVMSHKFNQLTEIDFRMGPLALYIEDAYVKALARLLKIAVPPREEDYDAMILAEAAALQKPLQLRLLQIHPMDVTLTLHTAVRIYIALDQSPLHLNAFTLHQMFTSSEALAHALTVHYLSAAILSAGWVVGGLELLGAPGALAARVGGATGGVRGIASTTAAALLRSLSCWAGSLARNLDLLAGDEEHARRAAAARRRPPATFIDGLIAGVTNFAINILGAVGGLAHHPLVGVAVGETGSGAAALRRSLVGAVTKPLSATADLVAYAGHGLLCQTGWDPVPQPRRYSGRSPAPAVGWRRDCVRWVFKLAELSPVAGFSALVDAAPATLLLTSKLLVIAEPDCERVIEMVDLRHCTVRPYSGGTIELQVLKNRLPKIAEARIINEDDEFHISEAAMQRVARYTGAGGGGGAAGGGGVLRLDAAPAHAHALHAALLALVHTNADSHFPLF